MDPQPPTLSPISPHRDLKEALTLSHGPRRRSPEQLAFRKSVRMTFTSTHQEENMVTAEIFRDT